MRLASGPVFGSSDARQRTAAREARRRDPKWRGGSMNEHGRALRSDTVAPEHHHCPHECEHPQPFKRGRAVVCAGGAWFVDGIETGRRAMHARHVRRVIRARRWRWLRLDRAATARRLASDRRGRAIQGRHPSSQGRHEAARRGLRACGPIRRPAVDRNSRCAYLACQHARVRRAG